jgi:hypothetical protein
MISCGTYRRFVDHESTFGTNAPRLKHQMLKIPIQLLFYGPSVQAGIIGSIGKDAFRRTIGFNVLVLGSMAAMFGVLRPFGD